MQPQWKEFVVGTRRPDRTDVAQGVLLGAALHPQVGTLAAVAAGACSALLPCVRVRKLAV